MGKSSLLDKLKDAAYWLWQKVRRKCTLCKDPIYSFQTTTDGMHSGCAQLTDAEKVLYA